MHLILSHHIGFIAQNRIEKELLKASLSLHQKTIRFTSQKNETRPPQATNLLPEMVLHFKALGLSKPSPSLRLDGLAPGLLRHVNGTIQHAIAHPPSLHLTDPSLPFMLASKTLALSLHPLDQAPKTSQKMGELASPVLETLGDVLGRSLSFTQACRFIQGLDFQHHEVLLSSPNEAAKITGRHIATLAPGGMLTTSQPRALHALSPDAAELPGALAHLSRLHQNRVDVSACSNQAHVDAWSVFDHTKALWVRTSSHVDDKTAPKKPSEALARWQRLSQQKGSPERALSDLERWAATWEECPEIHGLLGLVALQTMKTRRAISAFEHAIELGRGVLPLSQLNGLKVYLAWALSHARQPLRARHGLEQLVKEPLPCASFQKVVKRSIRKPPKPLRLRQLTPDALTLCYFEHLGS